MNPDPIAAAALDEGGLRPYAAAKADLLARFDVFYCEAALARTDGNIAKAARLARLDKKNLHRKIREHKIDARRFKK